MKRFIAIALSLFLAFSLLFVAFESLGWMDEQAFSARFQGMLQSSGMSWLAGPAASVLLVVDLALPIPSSVVMTLCGYLQGIFLGTLFNFLGTMGAALLGFAICRRFGQKGFQAVIGQQESLRVESFFQRYGVWAIVLSRSVPMLTEVISCLAGLSKMNPGRFAALSMLGSLPISLVYAWAGHMAQGSVPLGWLVLVAFLLPAAGLGVVKLLQLKNGQAIRSKAAGKSRLRNPSAGAIALLLGLSLLPSVRAQQDSAENKQEEGEGKQLPVLHETITVRAGPVSPAGASVTILEREDIQQSGARTVADLLRTVAGLHVLSAATRGGSTTVQVRGGDPNFTLILLDGVPLNDPTDQFGGVYNLEGVPASSIGRIEVVRGPLSTLYGSQALAGVIYLSTRQGQAGPPQIEAEVEGGNASLLRTATTLSGAGKNAHYFLGLGWEQEEERVAQEDFEAFNLQGRFGLRINPKTTFDLAARLAFWQADDYPEASGGPVLGSGRLRRSENDEFSFSAQLLHTASPTFEHSLTGSFYRHQLNRLSPGIGFVVPPSDEDTRLNRIRAGWSGSRRLSEEVELRVGADVDREEADSGSFLLLPAEFGGNIDGTYQDDRTTVGGFAELLFEKGRYQQEVGLRLDKPSGFDAVWSPRTSVSYWLPDERTRLRGSIGRAFKLPSFFALSSPRALGGNPGLLEETSWGGDVGLDHHVPAVGLTLGASYFHTRFKNLVDFDFNLFLHVNRSRVRTQGAELFLDWRPSSAWTLRSDLTFLDIDDLDSPLPLLHRPRRSGGASVAWQPHPRFDVYLEGRYVGGSFDNQIPVPERDRVEGYGLLNAALTWRLSRRLELSARFNNLTDSDYETFIGFPGPATSARLSLRLLSR